MFQLKFYIILLVVTVSGPINTFSAPLTTKLDQHANENELATVQPLRIHLNSTNNKLDEASSSGNIFISSSTISSRNSNSNSDSNNNSELIEKEASTVISTDAYFISGLSDLILENNDFDRLDEIERDLDKRNSNHFIVTATSRSRDDVTDVPTKIEAVSELPFAFSKESTSTMAPVTKQTKKVLKVRPMKTAKTTTTQLPPSFSTTESIESPETKVSPIKFTTQSTSMVTIKTRDANFIGDTATSTTPTIDGVATIYIIDKNEDTSSSTIATTTTTTKIFSTANPDPLSSLTLSAIAEKPKNKKKLRKKSNQKKIDVVDDDDGNQQVDVPTTPLISTTTTVTTTTVGIDTMDENQSPIIVEQVEYETRNGTTATANVTLNNKTEIIEVEIFDQNIMNLTKEAQQQQQQQQQKISDDLVKVINDDELLPLGANIDVLEVGGLDIGLVPAQSGGGSSSEYTTIDQPIGRAGATTTLEKNDEFIYADVDDGGSLDTVAVTRSHKTINTEKFPSTETTGNKMFQDIIPAQIDRDSDTIFYISNTEVKVVESIPTPDSTKLQDGGGGGGEQQPPMMVPEIYEEDLIIDLNNQQQMDNNNSRQNMMNSGEKYEEDIILSPLKNTNFFDPIKNFNDENLSISYVGESFIDIEESTNTPTVSISTSQQTISDVIIQPVIIPDIPMSIGVPVIGELPPQLDLRNDHIMDDVHGRSGGVDEHLITMKSQVIEHAGDNLFKNPLSADLRDDTIDKKRTEAAVLANRKTNATTSNGTHEVLSNGTLPFGEENDDHESGFSDIQTLFLACILTLAPLILSVIVAFGVRFVWKKYRRDHAVGSGLIGDNSTDPLASKSRTLSIDELKSTESAYTINRKSSDNLLDSSTEILSKFDGGFADGPNKQNHYGDGGCGGRGSGANGSIITMTLKNNHLIVETEERNDISRDMRETKMHYSPSEKDGVFVVECSRGADTGGMNKSISPLPNAKMNQITSNAMQKAEQNPDKSLTSNSMSAQFKLNNPDENGNHQEVQIHQPPEGAGSDDDGLAVPNGDRQASSSTGNSSNRPNSMATNTGLSQSDLSISSSSGSNQGYTYGHQAPYEVVTKEYMSPPVPRTSHSVSHCQNFNADDEMNGNGDNDAAGGDRNSSIASGTMVNGKTNDGTTNCSTDNGGTNTGNSSDRNRPVITAAIYKQSDDENKKPTITTQLNGTASEEDNGQPCRLMSDIQAEETRHEEKLLAEQRQLGNGVQDVVTTIAPVLTNGTVDGASNESEQFDSLAYLPDPPACDDIKPITDDSEVNMDSLPPPPPLSEIICSEGQAAVES